MDTHTFIVLVAIGLAAGVLSGFIGVGGGIIIVPALVFFVGMSQHGAQGTSLALMLPPIGILAVYDYYRAGEIDVPYAVVIGLAFIVGGFFGAKISLRLSPHLVKFIFGVIMLYVSVRMIWASYRMLFFHPK